MNRREKTLKEISLEEAYKLKGLEYENYKEFVMSVVDDLLMWEDSILESVEQFSSLRDVFDGKYTWEDLRQDCFKELDNEDSLISWLAEWKNILVIKHQ